MAIGTRRGIMLMNLGSPDSTEVKDVRKYLNEFLMDERVLDSAWLLRFILVRWIITPFRAPKSAHAYASVWTAEGSPLIVFSKQLKAALQQRITDPVEMAMRYGSPSPEEAFERLQKKCPGVEEVILLPLYPQYAMSSYETAVEYAKKIHQQRGYPFRLTCIRPYYNQPAYIKALAGHIRPYLQLDFDQLLFSYHGIPERHLRKTDITGHHCLGTPDCCEIGSPAHQRCYRHQCLETTRLVTSLLQIPREKFSVSFQSRLGREEWMKPYTDFRLLDMPGEGIKKLLVVCPAFVSDCLETLEEIAIRGKESFLKAGGVFFEMIPCLNTDPLWVEAIAGWLEDNAADNRELLLQ